MELPILERGETVGAVSVRKEGLYRVLTARAALRPGVQRLWLCGEGESACLGVLLPEGKALTLKKRLSRSAWEALPHPLHHAALAEPAPAPAPPPSVPLPPVEAPAPADRGHMQSVRLFGRRFVVFRS